MSTEQQVDCRRKPISELTRKQIALVIVLPGAFALYAPISAGLATAAVVRAHNLLKGAANDVASLGANLQSKAIVDVKLEAECSSGYSPLTGDDRFGLGKSNELDKQFAGSWPGTNAFCKCGAPGVPASYPAPPAGSF